MAPKTTQKPTQPAKPAASVKGTGSSSAAPKKTVTQATSVKAPAKPVKAAAKKAATPSKTAAKPAAPATKTASKPTAAVTSAAKAPATASAKPDATTNKPNKWDEIRQQLLQMKEETLREIARSIKSGSEVTIGEETTGDIYDQASSERDRELELILNDRERQKLHNIDDALLRMDEGEYGICEECDEEIPLGRLKAMPFTRHCVKCKSDLERLQAQTRRFEEERAYRDIPLGDDDEA